MHSKERPGGVPPLSRAISAPSQQKALRNHPSWDNNEDAKRALGPVIAKWLASGVLEYVAWDDRMLILLRPCGAVPKGTAPFYRLITDARFASRASDVASHRRRCGPGSGSVRRARQAVRAGRPRGPRLGTVGGHRGEARPMIII